MEFEIFRDKALNKIITEVEDLEEWKALCKDLGLEKQYELSTGSKSPIPYPFVNTHYKNIIDMLAPDFQEIEEYKKSTIPLEVLREVKLCVNENYFQKTIIHYDENSPDPFVIGITGFWYLYKSSRIEDKEGNSLKFKTKQEAEDCRASLYEKAKVYFDEEEKFLIAKFGEHNKTWEELKKLATERVMESCGAEIKNKLEDLNQAYKKIKENAILFINGDLTLSQVKGERW